METLAQRLSDARDEGWDAWIRNAADERAVCDGYHFDLAAAERVRTFFGKFLQHSKGQWAGRPL